MMSQTLIDLMDEGASRATPSKIAIHSSNTSLSYEQLKRGAEGIAASLTHAGISRGERVGVWMDKTPSCVQSLLGIMMAGAAYVPLDPRAPWRRCRIIIEDCDLAGLVVDAPHFQVLPQLLDGLTIKLTLTEGQVDENLANYFLKNSLKSQPLDRAMTTRPMTLSSPEADDLAYILYTSGSTGTPKGVMHSHRSAIAFVHWVQNTFEINHDDVFSSHAPFHFDLSISDLYASLGSGASVHLISTMEGMLAPYLVAKMAEWKITIWYSVPSILSDMLNIGSLEEHGFGKVRIIFFAGEVFPIAQLRRLRRALPSVQLANLYGPTETNVCNYYIVPKDMPDNQSAPIPIGKVCEHMEGFILNEEGSEVTEGKEGTLWIKGDNLMQGYWNNPERSSKDLREDPRGLPGMAYCTGDRVRKIDKGEYDYLGRLDHMVKTRGYRVELGEIENTLNCHPQVLEAVCCALADDKIGARIVASLVVRAGQTLDISALRAFCRERLPIYMTPDKIEVRETLPRTSTGKVDRQSLASEWHNNMDPSTVSV